METNQQTTKEKLCNLFLFRRDLRVQDNIGLYNAIKMSKKDKLPLHTLFIFNGEQISTPYTSYHSIHFMYESLVELKESLKNINISFTTFYVKNYKQYAALIIKLCDQFNSGKFIFNEDYTSYAIMRDSYIIELMKKHNFVYEIYSDPLLFHPCMLVNNNGNGYRKFTPFLLNALKFRVPKPYKVIVQNEYVKLNKNTIINKYIYKLNKFKSDYISTIKDDRKDKIEKHIYNDNNAYDISGGSTNAIYLLKNYIKYKGKSYNKNRDYVNMIDGNLQANTSLLSAHLRFGTIGVRYVYWTVRKLLGKSNKLMQQLYWRDFYYGIEYFYHNDKQTKKNNNKTYIHTISRIPDIQSKLNKMKNTVHWCKYNFYKSINENINSMKKQDKKNYDNWKKGKTGVDIVDDAMKLMNDTGYMHNRQRMIVASYLIFYLHIHWKFGEVYFSQTLIDHDYALNLGNWKWVAGIEPYSNDPNHIFSMDSQKKRLFI